jgi:chloramphenicol 3-O phosphotransferase
LKRSTVVLLNGVGSAGKSSIAKAMQTMTRRPFLHVQLDDFIGMMPPSSFGDPNGLLFEATITDGKPAAVIHTGPMGQTVFRGMRRAIAALADAGNDLIVDEVIWGDELADYRSLLEGHDLKTVAVRAPLEVLEQRERERGDRFIGLARWQFGRVHVGVAYDLEVNSDAASPEACARTIVEAFAL